MIMLKKTHTAITTQLNETIESLKKQIAEVNTANSRLEKTIDDLQLENDTVLSEKSNISRQLKIAKNRIIGLESDHQSLVEAQQENDVLYEKIEKILENEQVYEETYAQLIDLVNSTHNYLDGLLSGGVWQDNPEIREIVDFLGRARSAMFNAIKEKFNIENMEEVTSALRNKTEQEKIPIRHPSETANIYISSNSPAVHNSVNKGLAPQEKFDVRKYTEQQLEQQSRPSAKPE